jgi:predicted amidophosphoribosyltransferase
MKTKDCPACEQTVSKSAELCPHCGHRLKRRGIRMVDLAACIIVALVIAWLLGL